MFLIINIQYSKYKVYLKILNLLYYIISFILIEIYNFNKCQIIYGFLIQIDIDIDSYLRPSSIFSDQRTKRAKLIL